MVDLVAQRSCKPRRDGGRWACAQSRSEPGDWFCSHCGEPLPPIQIRLEPEQGWSAPTGGASRRVLVATSPATDLRADDFTGYSLAVTCSDPNEMADELSLPLGAPGAPGEVELGLDRPARSGPFDVTLSLRHDSRPDVAWPLVIGAYDYPPPRVVLEPAGDIEIPIAGAAFEARLVISPADAELQSAVLSVDALRLELEGVWDAAAQRLRLEPSAAQWIALGALNGAVKAKLALSFRGVLAPVNLSDVRLRRRTPPRLALAAAPRLRGLTGRRARIGVRLGNDGGSDAVIDQVAWSLATLTGEDVSRGVLSGYAGVTLVAQERLDDEFRPPLVDADGAALRPGRYQLTLEVDYRPGEEPEAAPTTLTSRLEIEARPDAPFSGMVCIDFGTTDTAAAILAPGRSYFQDPSSGVTPRPLELGRIAAPGAKPRYFLPTRAVIGVNHCGEPEIRYADAAVSDPPGLRHSRTIERLKWRLGQNAEVEGYDAELSIKDLAVGYLKEIRALVEEHPLVAARVERVVATRPARFARFQGLIEAFEEAGMAVDPHRFGVGVPPLVSESWPPLLFAVPLQEGRAAKPSARLLASLFDLFETEQPPEQIDLAALKAAPHYLCTVDVGGGSADFSLLRLDMHEERVEVADLDTRTDEHFAGEHFRDLILEQCQLYASDIPTGEADEISRRNLDAWRQLAGQIQNFPDGPYSLLRGIAETFFSALAVATPDEVAASLRFLEDSSPASASWDQPTDNVTLRDLWNSVVGAVGLLETLRVQLRQANGAPREVVFGGDQSAGDFYLGHLLCRVVVRFAQVYAGRIADVFDQLATHVEADARVDQTRVLLTGRGSLFPLVEALVQPMAQLHLGLRPDHLMRQLGESAKAVTSWGGAALRAAGDATGDLVFLGYRSSGFALYARRAVEVGFSRLPLASIKVGETELWGAPLTAFEGPMARARWLMASEDFGPNREPQELAALMNFDLGRERGARPNGWVLFDPDTNVLALGDGPALEDAAGGGE